jgi:hypothetical protein
MSAPKSPFPGFDPYVQPYWRDVHAALIVYTREALSGRLPGDLRARIEERLIVEAPYEEPPWRRGIAPDLVVMEREKKSSWRGGAAGGVAMAEPILVRPLAHPVRERYIQIVEPGLGGRVVTVIEFVSPTNKVPGEGRELYLQKQKEYLHGQVSSVEIDLIRGGKHAIALPEASIPEGMTTWPWICVRESWEFLLKFHPVSPRKRMPIFAIPLRQDDPPVALDLQAVFDRCFEVGEYGLDIDYRQDPQPPLSAEDAAWADELLREKGLRE